MCIKNAFSMQLCFTQLKYTKFTFLLQLSSNLVNCKLGLTSFFLYLQINHVRHRMRLDANEVVMQICTQLCVLQDILSRRMDIFSRLIDSVTMTKK